MRYFFRFLSIYLVAYLLFGNVPLVFAKKLKTSSQNASFSLAIVPVLNSETTNKQLQSVIDGLCDELNLKSTFKILPQSQVQNLLSNLETQQANFKVSPYAQVIEESKNLYLMYYFQQAVNLLEDNIRKYQSSTTVNTFFSLVEAHAYLANYYFALHHYKKTTQVMQQALLLDPNLKMTIEKYPPETVEYFEKVKSEFNLAQQPWGKIKIAAHPSQSEVWINGSYQGKTPLAAMEYPVGEHIVMLRKDGYQDLFEKVLVKPGKQNLDLSLSRLNESNPENLGLHSTQTGDEKKMMQQAMLLGNSLGVQKILLVSLKTVGWRSKIQTDLIDVQQGLQASKQTEVADLQNDMRSAAKVLVASLVNGAEIQKNKKEDVVVIGHKKKSKKALWVVLGIVLAGAGVGVAMMAGGGGGGSSGENPTTPMSGATSDTPGTLQVTGSIPQSP